MQGCWSTKGDVCDNSELRWAANTHLADYLVIGKHLAAETWNGWSDEEKGGG